MALQIADRVRETTTTSGTGTVDLAGATAGFQAFVAGIGAGNTCHYLLLDGTAWETGVGTVTDGSPDTLSRDTVIASSNAGAKIDLSGGETAVLCTLPGSASQIRAAIGITDNGIIDWTSTSSNLNTSGSVTSGALTANGNVTLGDASADSLTINAGTWTYGNNVVATRTMGAAPAGAGTAVHLFETTFNGDAGGTSDVTNFQSRPIYSGANNINLITAMRGVSRHAGSGTASTMRGQSYAVQLQSTGNATTVQGIVSQVELTSSGSVTGTVGTFEASAPNLSSTGTIATNIGFRARNLGHATLVTNAIGHDADNMTISPTLTVSYRSQQNSGTGAWAFLSTGTANSGMAGALILGATSAPVLSGSGKLDMNADLFRLRTAKTPSSAGDTGNQGETCWDSTYEYRCVATNTWERWTRATW